MTIKTLLKLYFLLFAGIGSIVAGSIGLFRFWEWVESVTCVWFGLTGFTASFLALIFAGFALAIEMATRTRTKP